MKKKLIAIVAIIVLLGGTVACQSCRQYFPNSNNSSESEITSSVIEKDTSSKEETTSSTTVNSEEEKTTTTSTTKKTTTTKAKTTSSKKTTTTTTKKKTTTTTTKKPTTTTTTKKVTTTTTTTAQKEVTWKRVSQYESTVLNEINNRRIEAGLEPFIACSSCKNHAAAQAEWNSANLVYGQLSWHSYSQCGSESSSPTQAPKSWFNSAAHKASMLSDYTHAGVAVYQVNYPEGVRYCTIISFHDEGFSCWHPVNTDVPDSYLRQK